MARIDQIIVDTFRGASKPLSLKFSPKKTLAVIFGENGTGKTTIVDAIDVVANQNVGSIRDRSSTSAGKHAHTIGTNQAAISIVLKSANRDWTATMKGGQFTVFPDSPPRVRVLRKSNLQRFIDAKPADRYTELKYLIAVDRVEKSEQALKEAASDANAEAGRHSHARASAESSLERIWLKAGSPSSSAIAWAQYETSQEQPNDQRQVSHLSKLVEALR
jgi:predicted ATP-binding protein involved in virulence